MERRFIEKLTCPACSASSRATFPLGGSPDQANGPRCPICSTIYKNDRGMIDFVGVGRRAISLSQWAMEFRPIVAIYEKIWRPLITIPFSDLSWEMKTACDLLDLRPDHDLLDIACGTGNFTRLFSETVRNGAIIGADLSLPMLVKAMHELKKRGLANIMFMRVDVTQWPFAAHSFDRIHCAGGLHIIPEVQSVFHSVSKSLKPDGIFVGATYTKGRGSRARLMQDAFSAHSGFHWFEPEELFGLADRAGFVEWEQHIKKQAILFRVRKRIS